MSTPTFFNKISQVSMTELLEFLGHNQTEITIKIINQYIKTNINSRKSEKALSVLKFSSYDFSNEPIICSFQTKEDRYFFKSYLNSNNSDYSIEVPDEVFQLQRRNDFRVSMPMGVVYTCEIRNINGSTKAIKAEIRDMSLGGCQVSVAGGSEVKKDDEVDLYVKLDKFEFAKLPLNVKHVKNIEGQNTLLIGASFFQLGGALTSELQSMLMHLDRVQRGKANQ
ncbi:MAG: PilZ domain-containing protein [Pseudobdellovibrio sp.]